MNTSTPKNAQQYFDSDHMIVSNDVMVLTLYVKVIIFLFIFPRRLAHYGRNM